MKTLATIIAGAAAVLLVGVFLISVSLTSSSAAECNAGADLGGRLKAGDSVMIETTFCSDPSDSLVGWVNWGKKSSPDRDLAVVVTSPSGMQLVFNDGPSSTQTFIVFGPLEEGDWMIEVVNVGTRDVKYDLQMAFG
jgi:hypothetical protein